LIIGVQAICESAEAPKTLRKHFRHELDLGMAEANGEIVDSLFANAKKGNVAAQIYLAKTRLHWRECDAAERPTLESGAEPLRR
jgi:hypothetical protein